MTLGSIGMIHPLEFHHFWCKAFILVLQFSSKKQFGLIFLIKHRDRIFSPENVYWVDPAWQPNPTTPLECEMMCSTVIIWSSYTSCWEPLSPPFLSECLIPWLQYSFFSHFSFGGPDGSIHHAPWAPKQICTATPSTTLGRPWHHLILRTNYWRNH